MITLNVPPAFEDRIVDWLLARDSRSGFTADAAYGHGSRHDNLSIAEQVSGRQRRTEFRVTLAAPLLDAFVGDLRLHSGRLTSTTGRCSDSSRAPGRVAIEQAEPIGAWRHDPAPVGPQPLPCLLYALHERQACRNGPAKSANRVRTMMRSPTFWVLLLVFQLAFGLAVFALTRNHYIHSASGAESAAWTRSEPIWQRGTAPSPDLSLVDAVRTTAPLSDDPGEIARQADMFFTARQYEDAALLYERLLQLDPDNSNTLNNLGITLHYLGRSAEALVRLNEGVAADPAHQRLWLTLGFVNSQLGNVEQARIALTNAQQVDSDEQIRESARAMLQELP